jgi:hypothetical protein
LADVERIVEAENRLMKGEKEEIIVISSGGRKNFVGEID